MASIPMGTKQYRQYHAGAVKNFMCLGDEESAQDAGAVATLHRQAGILRVLRTMFMAFAVRTG